MQTLRELFTPDMTKILQFVVGTATFVGTVVATVMIKRARGKIDSEMTDTGNGSMKGLVQRNDAEIKEVKILIQRNDGEIRGVREQMGVQNDRLASIEDRLSGMENRFTGIERNVSLITEVVLKNSTAKR